jgi:hypothetical protein
MDPGNGHCEPDDGGKRGPQAPDPAYGDTNPDNSSPHHGSGGGGSSHHSCGFFGCTLSNFAHKAYHAVTQHPVIAAVVATAVVVGVVACVVATAGGCGAVLAAGAEGFTAGAEAGSLGAAAVGASVGVAAEGGAVVAGSSAIAGAGAAAVAEGAETASASKAATESGARAADSAAEGTAGSGAARGSERADTAAPKSGPSGCNCDHAELQSELTQLGKDRIEEVKSSLSEGEILPGAFSVGRDQTTGTTYYGESGPATGHHTDVISRLPGESQLPNGRPPGVCAEARMCTNALNDGASLENLDIITLNQKGKKFKMCPNCQTWVPGAVRNVLTG